MSRLTARKRWLMAGPWPHPKTGILYYRKATPPDLFAARDILAGYGIKVTREVQRSLETKDQKPAEQKYVKIAADQETEWHRWRDLLRNGPQPLPYKQRIGLAADHARAFLAKHEDEPFDAPAPRTMPSLIQLPADAASKRALAVEALANLADALKDDTLKSDFLEFYDAEGERSRELGLLLLEKHPALASTQFPLLIEALDYLHGPDTDEALKSNGQQTDPWTRTQINLEMVRQMGAARRGLRLRENGDYGPVEEMERAPSFSASPLPTAENTPQLSLLDLWDHKVGRGGIRPRTASTYRSRLLKFTAFVGHDDAMRVEKKDVRGWRDSLIAQTAPQLSVKTINNSYLAALKSTLAWGVKEFDLPNNVAADIRDGRDSPAPIRSKGWTVQEAHKILAATFNGTTKALSLPHKRALFWVPWICAYTGLRVTEVTQLRGTSLRWDGDTPFLLIDPADGSTKGDNSWTTGVHQHLIDLGVIEVFRAAGDGPAFYTPYPAGTDMRSVLSHRSESAADRVAEWVKAEVGMAELARPNHAWRHAFTTSSRSVQMDKEARDYMLGSRSAVDAREGYGDWPPNVVDRQVNKLPRYVVEETNWRPSVEKVDAQALRGSTPTKRIRKQPNRKKKLSQGD